jgi:hypothetical protein
LDDSWKVEQAHSLLVGAGKYKEKLRKLVERDSQILMGE